MAIFWDVIGLGNKNLIIIGFVGVLAFGVAIAGLILGLTEIRKTRTVGTWIGIVGNLLITLVCIYSMIQGLMLNN